MTSQPAAPHAVAAWRARDAPAHDDRRIACGAGPRARHPAPGRGGPAEERARHVSRRRTVRSAVRRAGAARRHRLHPSGARPVVRAADYRSQPGSAGAHVRHHPDDDEHDRRRSRPPVPAATDDRLARRRYLPLPDDASADAAARGGLRARPRSDDGRADPRGRGVLLLRPDGGDLDRAPDGVGAGGAGVAARHGIRHPVPAAAHDAARCRVGARLGSVWPTSRGCRSPRPRRPRSSTDAPTAPRTARRRAGWPGGRSVRRPLRPSGCPDGR